MVDFDKLNRQTRDFNNRNVDRFNPSTQGNYNRPNFDRMNANTYASNNHTYSDLYRKYGR